MEPIRKDLRDLIDELDNINDDFYLSVQHLDKSRMDTAGREMVRLGQVIKDKAAKL